MADRKPRKIRLGRPRTQRYGQQREPTQTTLVHVQDVDKHGNSHPGSIQHESKDLLYLYLIVQASGVPIFDLPEKYGVQDTAPRDRRCKDEGFPYLLGSGASCTVVQHETSDDTGDIVPEGTIVALKAYTKVRRYTDLDSAASKDLVSNMWRDMRILCHPYLGQHENFCRLLYIAWEPYNIVPLLALELAAFGSLKDVLESDTELSWLQKSHISMDIAVGLHSLHSCGFIHGDIKPSNIMIQEHPNRQLVAKISDFAGTADVSNYIAGSQQRFRTRLWTAPEVLLGNDNSVEYRGADDVFAFGLVLAHIWRNGELKDFDHECFLEYELPKTLTFQEKEDMILYHKCCPESDTSSAMSQALRWAQKHSVDIRNRTNHPIFLHGVLKSALSPTPRKRASMTRILKYFELFASHHRDTRIADIIESAEKNHGIDKLVRVSKYGLFVHSDTFADRSFEHKTHVLEYMQDSTPDPMFGRTALKLGIDTDYEDIDRLRLLIAQNLKIVDANRSQPDYSWRLTHYQISCCYFRGHGTIIDEQKGLQYLASAALGGVKRAMVTFPALEKSCILPLAIDLPRRLFLVLGYAAGVMQSADLLLADYPSVFTLVRLILFHTLWLEKSVPELQVSTVSAPPTSEKKDEKQSLFARSRSPIRYENKELAAAIEAGDIGVVRELLDEGLDPDTMFENGISALHAVSLSVSSRASEIAALLLEKGADISVFADEELDTLTSQFYAGKYSPIHWAISKNRLLLYQTYLRWWQTHPQIPADGGFQLTASLVYHRRPEMLKMYAEFLRESGEEIEILSENKLTCMLHAAVEEIDYTIIDQRWNQRSRFRENRLAVAEYLLQLGADPLLAMDGESPLKHAIIQGDNVCMQAMLTHVQGKGVDIALLLSRGGLFREGLVSETIQFSVLYSSLFAVSMEGFDALMVSHPDLINQSTSNGATPLILAAEIGNMHAVKALLEAGANPTLHRTDTGATALTKALTKGHYRIATLILECGVDRDELIYLRSSVGGSVFDMVLGTYLTGRRHIEIQAFEFLRAAGGCNFLMLHAPKTNVFRRMLIRRRPVLQEDVQKDIELLRLFLRIDVYGRYIDELDYTGRAIIHYAAQYVYVEVLELVINMGAELNLEAIAPSDEDLVQGVNIRWNGWTAIDMVMEARTNAIPDYILAGGLSEIRGWQVRLQKALNVLVKAGACCGSKSPGLNRVELLKLREPEAFKRVFISDMNKPLRGDQRWHKRSRWPRKLPVCVTETREEGADRGTETVAESTGSSEDDRAEQRRDTPIIYWTPKGRRFKTTPRYLELFGASIDVSSSEEDSDDVKSAIRGMLEYNRSYIALKRKEVLEASMSATVHGSHTLLH